MSLRADLADGLTAADADTRREAAEELRRLARDDPDLVSDEAGALVGALVRMDDSGPEQAWGAVQSLVMKDREAAEQACDTCLDSLSRDDVSPHDREQIAETLLSAARHQAPCLEEELTTIAGWLGQGGSDTTLEDVLVGYAELKLARVREVRDALRTTVDSDPDGEESASQFRAAARIYFELVSDRQLLDTMWWPALVARALVVDDTRRAARSALDSGLGEDPDQDATVLGVLEELVADRVDLSVDSRGAVAEALSQLARRRPEYAAENDVWELLLRLAVEGLPGWVAESMVRATVSLAEETPGSAATESEPGDDAFYTVRTRTAALTKLVVRGDTDFASPVVGQLLDELGLPAVCGLADVCESQGDLPEPLAEPLSVGVSEGLWTGVRDDSLSQLAVSGLDWLLRSGIVPPDESLATAVRGLHADHETGADDEHVQVAVTAVGVAPTDDVVQTLLSTIGPLLEEGATERLSTLLRGTAEADSRAAGQFADGLLTDFPVDEYDVDVATAALVLSTLSEEVPAALAEAAGPVSELLDAEDTAVRRDAAQVIRRVAGTDPGAVEPHLEALLDALDDSEPRVRSAVAETIGKLAVYPPPDQLEALDDDDQPRSVQRAAAAAVNRLETRHEATPLSRTSGADAIGTEPGSALVDTATGSGRLWYRSSEGRWERATVGPVDEELLTAVGECYETRKSAKVTYPYYAPETAVQSAVELFCRDPSAVLAMVTPVYSEGHWGLKSDIREEYARYGVADGGSTGAESEDSVRRAATPMSETVSPGYVSDGAVKRYGDGVEEGALVLVNDPEEVADLDQVDAVLVNYAARADKDVETVRETLNEAHPDVPVVLLDSVYTRRDVDEYGRKYGPTVTDLETVGTAEAFEVTADREADLVAELSDAGGGPNVPHSTVGVTDAVRFAEHRRVELTTVECERATRELEETWDMADELRDEGAYDLSSRLMSVQFVLERMLLPVDRYDERIEERRRQGERYLPTKVATLLDNLDHEAGSFDGPGHSDTARDAVRRFDDVVGALEAPNPLYEHLVGRVDEARETGGSVAVFCSKQRTREIAETVLTEDGYSPDGPHLTLVTPSEARSIGHHDRLVIVGPQKPQYAGFHLLPRVDTVELVTLGERWHHFARKYVERYLERLVRAAGLGSGSVEEFDVEDYVDFERNTVVAEPESEAETVDTDDGAWGSSTPAASTGASSDALDTTPVTDADAGESAGTLEASSSLLDRAFETAERYAGADEGGGRGTADGDHRKFRVECADGSSFELSGSDRVLREIGATAPDDSEVEGGEIRYRWEPPEALAPDDVIHRIDDQTRAAVWEEWLRDQLSDELSGADDVFAEFELWYETVEGLLGAYTSGADTVDYDGLVRTAQEADVNRTEQTVRSWFESVKLADRPVDLVADPSLRTGPRKEADLRRLAEAFDEQELADRSRSVNAAMRALRTFNQQHGDDFRDELHAAVRGDGKQHLTAALRRYRVEHVTEVTDE